MNRDQKEFRLNDYDVKTVIGRVFLAGRYAERTIFLYEVQMRMHSISPEQI